MEIIVELGDRVDVASGGVLITVQRDIGREL